MAIPDSLQTTVSAFIFGTLFQTAIAAVLRYLRGYGLKVIHDRRRLVLVIFFTTAGMWAQVDFIGYAVPPTSEGVCQGTVAASTFFDQASRTIVGGFLLWSVGHVRKSKQETYGLATLVGARAVLGIVFVAFTRPQFAPVCVARSQVLPISAAVIALDVVVIGILSIRMFTLGFVEMIRDVRSATKREQSKALIYCTASFFLWTATSSAMLLGIRSTVLILRTALPAIGLMILIIVMTMQSGALVLPLDQNLVTPEARSPFVEIRSRSVESAIDRYGSPFSGTGHRKKGRLDVLSSTRNVASQSDSKAMSSARLPSAMNKGVENRSGGSARGVHSPAMAADAIISVAARGLENQGRVIRPKNTTIAERRQNRVFPGRGKGIGEESSARIAISGPIPQDFKPSQPKKVKFAVPGDERSRREEVGESLLATRVAPLPPIMATSDALRKVSITKRKDSPTLKRRPKESISVSSRLGLSKDIKATLLSASRDPDVRQRSPRTLRGLEQDIELIEMQKLPEIPRQRTPFLEFDQETAVYLNGTDYDQPTSANSVVKGAARNSMRRKSSENKLIDPPSPLNSTPFGSVMHRPRPQRRGSEQYRGLFPSQRMPAKRVTKTRSGISGDFSFATRARKLDSAVPSPPQRPISAAGLPKLPSQDSGSMTALERLSLLFPASPETPNSHTRSSISSLPRIPSAVLGLDSLSDILAEIEQPKRVSLTKRRVSLSTSPRKEFTKPEAAVFEFTPTSIPEASVDNIDTPAAVEMKPSTIRREETSAFSVSDFGGEEYQDRARSAYASLPSPISAVEITTTMQTAFVQTPKEPTTAGEPITDGKRPESVLSVLVNNDHDSTVDDGEGSVSVTLGVGTADILGSPAGRTFLMDASPSIPWPKQILPELDFTWHRRIGDELLTFSERRKYSTTQSAPPPPPLQLVSYGRVAKVISREPVPDEEVDTPGKAMKAIQAQLGKFDEPGRDSWVFRLSYVSMDSSRSIDAGNEDALGLIANLEKEMGQQETHWMMMQYDLRRDSNSVIISPSIVGLKSLPSPPPSEESPQIGSSRTRGLIPKRPRSEESIINLSPQHSETSRPSSWQRQLAEAQLDFAKTKSALLGSRFMSLLSISKRVIGSPTPPDSLDSGTDFDRTDDDLEEVSYHTAHTSTIISMNRTKVDLLWTAKPPAIKTGHLWSRIPGRLGAFASTFKPAMLVGRRRPGRDYQPSFITSSTLWSKPLVKENNHGAGGLWGTTKTGSRSIVTRPKTQKPSRKSRRMTFLADIVENPSPLLNKRGTLGIFQFPWGEKSDSAMFGPGQLPNGRNNQDFTSRYLETKPLPVPPELEEFDDYSSTFFGDYGEVYINGSDGNSDDEFDEATLWEIANLLHSHEAPSKGNLLPAPRIIEDYDDDDFLGDEMTESTQDYSPVDHSPAQSPRALALSFQPSTPPFVQSWAKTSEYITRIEKGTNNSEDLILPSTNERIGAESKINGNQAPIPSKHTLDNDGRAPRQPNRANTHPGRQQIVTKRGDLTSDIENRWSTDEVDLAEILRARQTYLNPLSLHPTSSRGSSLLPPRDVRDSKVEAPAGKEDFSKKARRTTRLVFPNFF